jgi:HK97 family phage major capsid protein
MEANKEAIEKIKKGQKADLEALTINKVAITMTEAASLNSSVFLPNAQVQPGVIDLVRQQPLFWEYLTKGRTSANPLIWVNKTNKQGNAEFIGEGVLKPLASFELETETSTAKKVAERMKVSTEMLHDVDGLVSMIENELRFEVLVAASTAVLTGAVSATVPAGITT